MNDNTVLEKMRMDKDSGARKVSQIQYKHQIMHYPNRSSPYHTITSNSISILYKCSIKDANLHKIPELYTDV